MAYIDNTDTKKEMNDAMRGNAVSNIAPTKIIDSVQPVININPKDYRRCNIIKSTSSAGTVYTTPADKDFYLTGVFFSGSNKTASQDSVVSVAFVPKGATSLTVLSLTYSTTAILDTNHANDNVVFPFPILLERSSSLILTSTNNATQRLSIFGYTVEP